MPLSDHEQRILEEIERRLAADDPRFARHVVFPSAQGKVASRVKRSAAAFAAGFALLIVGLFVPRMLLAFGLGAFAVMLVSIVLITTTLKHAERGAGSVTRRPAEWFARLEERWRKRFERGDGR